MALRHEPLPGTVLDENKGDRDKCQKNQQLNIVSNLVSFAIKTSSTLYTINEESLQVRNQ